MSTSAQRAWRVDCNGRTRAHAVGRCSELQAFFELHCELGCKHLTYRTPKDIKDKDNAESGTGLRCRQCSHNRGMVQPKPVSTHEAAAWQVVKELFKFHMLVEIRTLGGNWGAADIWLPWLPSGQRIDLIIMIDGEKHFSGGGWEISVAEQKVKDHNFNEECWKQDHRLLRMYSDDRQEWGQLITEALRKSEHAPMQKFQMFSFKYGNRTSEVNRDACMSFCHRRKSGTYFEGQ